MRIWTIQPETLYAELKVKRLLHCDPIKSVFITEWEYKPAYDWLAEQMKFYIGDPPCR